jgi:hypothetical protein
VFHGLEEGLGHANLTLGRWEVWIGAIGLITTAIANPEGVSVALHSGLQSLLRRFRPSPVVDAGERVQLVEAMAGGHQTDRA